MIIGIYQSLITIHIIFVFHGSASEIQINENITQLVGSNRVNLTCNFTQRDGIASVSFRARNLTSNKFEEIAAFIMNFKSSMTDFGKYLFGDISLETITASTTEVNIEFNNLQCKHEREYMCKILAYAVGSTPVPVATSEVAMISVIATPSKPDSVSILHTPADSSITSAQHMEYSTSNPQTSVTPKEIANFTTLLADEQNDTSTSNNSTTPAIDHNTTSSIPTGNDVSSNISYITTTYSTQQTTSVLGIAEGDNITVVCTGDVGKPPATYVFQKYVNRQIVPMEDTFTATSISEMSENCSYYRTSNLTFQVTAEDNNAVIRCVVNSSITDSNLFIDMDPLDVYYKVSMPTITKSPNKAYYVVGEDSSIHLTCKSDGNPNPTYQWYKENDNEFISPGANMTITDVNITNSGVYTCTISNTFNGYTYENASNVQIFITNKAYTTRTTLKHSSTLADISTIQSSSTSSSSGVDDKEENPKGNLGLVVGIVVAVVTVIVVMIIIIACRRRRNKSPTFKNVSNSFDDSKPKPITEPRTGDYDYIALEDDPPKSSNNGLEVEDINKHNAEYLKKQEEEEKKKNESNTPPQPAVYAQVNEASKLKNKQKTEAIDSIGKQEEDTYAETQDGIYDKAGDRRHKENENDEHYDTSNNSSKQNSNGDNKLSTQTSQVGSYANQGFEKDDNRKVATVSPTVRSSSSTQNDERTNSNRNSQSKKGYENIIGTEQTSISEDDSSHRTAL